MPNKTLSEEERLQLAAQLDQDLDNFIDNLPKRQQSEPVPFDRWEEEISNHPFFLQGPPDASSDLHPLYEGLQKLKYDPDENEPEELALAYKDDGNFNFKHKKYRMAIISYTEGLKAKSGNSKTDAVLYNNRSAAHYFLKNYRSALMDAEASLKLNPGYIKVLIRAANCCFSLGKYDRAVLFCDQVLEIDKTNNEAFNLRKQSVNNAKVKERDQRKREIAERKVRLEEERVLSEIRKRGIKIEGGSENLTLTRLEPQFPELFNRRVSLSEDDSLVWPVVLFYPEYKIMDYIQQFDERNTFLCQLSQVFETVPEWDDERKYKIENLNVYFEDDRRKATKIDIHRTLLEVLKFERHVIKEGTPKFIIFVANTKPEQLFLAHSQFILSRD